MPVNAEKYFMTHLGFELTTSVTPPSTALSVTSTYCAIETTPKTDCSNSADIDIGYIYIYIYIYKGIGILDVKC